MGMYGYGELYVVMYSYVGLCMVYIWLSMAMYACVGLCMGM